MQLKASTDYALRTVLYLAMNGGIYSSKEISTAIAVPRDYLIQLAQLLRNAGIIEAKAGKTGGYMLAKPIDGITFLDVINAVKEDKPQHKDNSQKDAGQQKDAVQYNDAGQRQDKVQCNLINVDEEESPDNHLDIGHAQAQTKALPQMVESMNVAMSFALTSYEAYLNSITMDMLIRCIKDESRIGDYLSDRLRAESDRLHECKLA